MKALVTGGLGFIGSNLSRMLLEEGFEVAVIDNLLLGNRSNVSDIASSLKIIIGDIENTSDLEKVGKVDVIFHLAGASASPMFDENNLTKTFRNNIEGFVQLLLFAKRTDVKKILFASTSSLYFNNHPPLVEDSIVQPPNFYSVTKFTMEHIAYVFSKLYGQEILGFRFFSVYGKNEQSKGIYANLASQFLWTMKKRGIPIIYGDGKQKRDFIFVDDVTRALIMASLSQKKFGFEAFNIGTTKQYSLNELVSVINKVLGENIKPKYIPNPMIKNYIYSQQSDISKIQKAFWWSPMISLPVGLKTLAGLK